MSKKVTFGETMDWVVVKKPTGYYVTLLEEEYRTNGLKKTFYGN